MRLQQITETSHEDIRDMLRRDCMPYLKMIGPPSEIIAWRGMEGKYESDSFGKHKAHLTDRRPSSTTPRLHTFLNKWFTTNFGQPFRNGVFVTGDIDTAETYAEPYAIFPIGNFQYLYHKEIDDLFTGIQLSYSTPKLKVLNQLEEIKDGYRTVGMDIAIRSGNEIMLWVEEYYYVHPSIVKRLHI